MRDFLKFWKRQYSAVNTSESSAPQTDEKLRRASFLTGRRMSFDQGIPIIDSFFHQRKTGEQTREPKRNFPLNVIN